MNVLVIDLGLYPYVATALAASGKFDNVWFWTPWHDAFPISRHALWGTGLPGVTRVNDCWDYVADADLIVFPDVGLEDWQMFLRALGKRVWGSGRAGVLELDRGALKRLMESLGMRVPPYWLVDGMDALRAHLEDPEHADQWVKISQYRGDAETHHHRDWWLTKPWIEQKTHQFGPAGATTQFVVEGRIDGIEVGYDGWCIDGIYPAVGMYGYEAKDVAYVGRIVLYKQIPAVLRDVNEQLAPVQAELGCRSFFSTEVRVTPDGDGYLTDPTERVPSPPGGALLAGFSNVPDIVFDGADGVVVTPVPTATHTACLVLRSPWAEDDFLALRFPEEFRHLLALHGHAIMDGTDYVVSLGMDVIGEAVGLGNTMEEAIKQATEVAKSVEGLEVTFDDGGFDALRKKVDEGVQCGIDWS